MIEEDEKMALFESFERRIDKINGVLNSYGIASLEEAEKSTKRNFTSIRFKLPSNNLK